eukprot:3687963-Rhodomonas_salina.3
MMSSSSVCVVAAFVGLQFAGVDSFITPGAVGALQRAPALKMSSPSLRRGHFSPSMLALDNESDRALLMMENEARMSIAPSRTKALKKALSQASKPNSLVHHVVEYVLVATVLAKTIVGLFKDMVLAAPAAAKQLTAATFNAERRNAVSEKVAAVRFKANEIVYNFIEEIAFHFTFLYKFAISVWEAFSLRFHQIEEKLGRLSQGRRNSRRNSVTAVSAERRD